MKHSCYDCRHLLLGSPGSAMDYEGWPSECRAKASRAYIKSFPYKNTKCPDFEANLTGLEKNK